MADERFSRAERIFGEDGMERLARARVLVLGLGGVGGHAAEALARGGVGHLTIVDGDVVALSNLNRQAVATARTVGMKKADAMKDRLLSILPDLDVEAKNLFYTPETADEFDLSGYDCVIDCVDMVAAKIELAVRCEREGVFLLSAMGAGNKIDPSRFQAADIYETDTCPLARVMRRELKKRGVKHLRVVYSKEEPKSDGQRTPGSTSFTPGVMGMILAGEAIKKIVYGEAES